MKSTPLALTFASCVFVLWGCSAEPAKDGPGGDDLTSDARDRESEDDSDSEDTTTPQEEAKPAAKPDTSKEQTQSPEPGVPPAAAGFTLEMKATLTNAMGLCAQADKDILRTADCTGDESQKFAIYKMPDNAYELCFKDALTAANAGTATEEYRSTCLQQTNETTVRFAETVLSKKVGDSFQGQGGHILAEPEDILGWKDSARKLTRDSAGVVVLGKLSRNPDQKWKIGQ